MKATTIIILGEKDRKNIDKMDSIIQFICDNSLDSKKDCVACPFWQFCKDPKDTPTENFKSVIEHFFTDIHIDYE